MSEAVFFRNLTTKGLTAINSGERYFEGYLTVQVKDKQGEVTIVDELMKVLPVWIDRGAPISDTHSNRIIGKGINYSKVEYTDKDGEVYPAIKVTGKIHKNYELDNDIWQKIKSGEYKGLSFGGATKSDREPMQMKDGSIAYSLKDLEHYEVAVCRDPAVPLALITEFNTLAKAAVEGEDIGGGRMLIKCSKFGCYVDKQEQHEKPRGRGPEYDRQHAAEQKELSQQMGDVVGQTNEYNTRRRLGLKPGVPFKRTQFPGGKTAAEAGLKAPEARNEALVYDDETHDQPSETPLIKSCPWCTTSGKGTVNPAEERHDYKKLKEIHDDDPDRFHADFPFKKDKAEKTMEEHDEEFKKQQCTTPGCKEHAPKTGDCPYCDGFVAGHTMIFGGPDWDKHRKHHAINPTGTPSDPIKHYVRHGRRQAGEYVDEGQVHSENEAKKLTEEKKGEDWSNADGDRHSMYNQDTDEGGMGKHKQKGCKCGDPKCKDPKCNKHKREVGTGHGGEKNDTGEVHWSGSGSPYPKVVKGCGCHHEEEKKEKKKGHYSTDVRDYESEDGLGREGPKETKEGHITRRKRKRRPKKAAIITNILSRLKSMKLKQAPKDIARPTQSGNVPKKDSWYEQIGTKDTGIVSRIREPRGQSHGAQSTAERKRGKNDRVPKYLHGLYPQTEMEDALKDPRKRKAIMTNILSRLKSMKLITKPQAYPKGDKRGEKDVCEEKGVCPDAVFEGTEFITTNEQKTLDEEERNRDKLNPTMGEEYSDLQDFTEAEGKHSVQSRPGAKKRMKEIEIEEKKQQAKHIKTGRQSVNQAVKGTGIPGSRGHGGPGYSFSHTLPTRSGKKKDPRRTKKRKLTAGEKEKIAFEKNPNPDVVANYERNIKEMSKKAVMTNILSRLKSMKLKGKKREQQGMLNYNYLFDKPDIEQGVTHGKKKIKKEGEYGGMNTGEVEWTEPRDTSNDRRDSKLEKK